MVLMVGQGWAWALSKVVTGKPSLLKLRPKNLKRSCGLAFLLPSIVTIVDSKFLLANISKLCFQRNTFLRRMFSQP